MNDDTKAILARRARYVAMALAGIGTATQATACVCLDPTVGPDADIDANRDAPCIPTDANVDAHFEFDADIRYADANYDVAVERDVGAPADDATDAEDADEDAR